MNDRWVDTLEENNSPPDGNHITRTCVCVCDVWACFYSCSSLLIEGPPKALNYSIWVETALSPSLWNFSLLCKQTSYSAVCYIHILIYAYSIHIFTYLYLHQFNYISQVYEQYEIYIFLKFPVLYLHPLSVSNSAGLWQNNSIWLKQKGVWNECSPPSLLPLDWVML